MNWSLIKLRCRFNTVTTIGEYGWIRDLFHVMRSTMTRLLLFRTVFITIFVVIIAFYGAWYMYYHPRSLSPSFISVATATQPCSGNGADLCRLEVDKDHDVLVFLHIQKTGGTEFGERLILDLNVTRPCICRIKNVPKSHRRLFGCKCRNVHDHMWIFSRYSPGWLCGVHADWTELNECVDRKLNEVEKERRDRNYLYVTMLRNPVERYISEWLHVGRGNTWSTSTLSCNGRPASIVEVPFCFTGENWANVTLNDFMSCPSNLASNRQMRMLANLSLVGCYDESVVPDRAERERILLQSAKENLCSMAYFGLTEFQQESQFLFERTFDVHFVRNFEQVDDTTAKSTEVTEKDRESIAGLNRLDIQLYEYSKELFFQRLKYVGWDRGIVV